MEAEVRGVGQTTSPSAAIVAVSRTIQPLLVKQDRPQAVNPLPWPWNQLTVALVPQQQLCCPTNLCSVTQPLAHPDPPGRPGRR